MDTLAYPKLKRSEDRAYLIWIKTFPCVYCEKGLDKWHFLMAYVDPDHQNRFDDYSALPVCRFHHSLRHAKAKSELKKYGIRPKMLIKKYNKMYKEKD